MNISFAWLNGPELLLLLAVAILFFGAKKLPELARGFGQGLKEFRKAASDTNNDLNRR